MLFLLGTMRSGTTYFRNLLASNHQIRSVGSELNEFWTTVGRAPCGTVPSCPARSADDVSPQIRDDVTKFFDAQYRGRNAVSQIAYRLYRRTRFGNEVALKRGRPFYLLNKSTHLMNKVGYIDALFPEARYILIVRDIHSHSNSMYRHLFGLSEAWHIELPDTPDACWRFERRTSPPTHETPAVDFTKIPLGWIRLNALALDELHRCAPTRSLVVSFERLAEDPTGVLQRVGRFLDLEAINLDIETKLVNNQTIDPVSAWTSQLSVEQASAIEQAVEAGRADYDRISAARAEGIG